MLAANFRGLINSGDRTQSVMVVTTVNPKIFGGNLYMNLMPVTKFYLDSELQAIAEFTARYELIRSLQSVESTALAKIQEADFICKGRVVEVMQQNGWSFVSCTGCSRKLEKFGTSLHCNRCVNPIATGVIKYRVELLVDDGNDNATFVVFDREMFKLTKQDAAGLT
ncbi:hypothetical protein Bca52824_025573 [Brassica carinata]|uniref:Replication factor A C-terminal domain-containing protein n=1 Tax=Brassica carinata TaxID=52824 RepID=A0A8X7SFV6_BRACI|nr:hypothetical protein Bca52824_025573 [Brassica carinata]